LIAAARAPIGSVSFTSAKRRAAVLRFRRFDESVAAFLTESP
jgi:hypothetical protein